MARASTGPPSRVDAAAARHQRQLECAHGRGDGAGLAGGQQLDRLVVIDQGGVIDDLARHPVEQAGWGRANLGPGPSHPTAAPGEDLASHPAEHGLELGGGLGRQALGTEQRPESLGKRRPGPGQGDGESARRSGRQPSIGGSGGDWVTKRVW